MDPRQAKQEFLTKVSDLRGTFCGIGVTILSLNLTEPHILHEGFRLLALPHIHSRKEYQMIQCLVNQLSPTLGRTLTDDTLKLIDYYLFNLWNMLYFFLCGYTASRMCSKLLFFFSIVLFPSFLAAYLLKLLCFYFYKSGWSIFFHHNTNWLFDPFCNIVRF